MSQVTELPQNCKVMKRFCRIENQTQKTVTALHLSMILEFTVGELAILDRNGYLSPLQAKLARRLGADQIQ